MAATEQTVNKRAAAWTVAVHALLLLLFFFFQYSLPAKEPVQEMGMEVNLGTSTDGMGTDQPMSMEDPAPEAAAATNVSSAQQTTAAKEMEESNEPDAPAVNMPHNSKTETRNNTQEEPKKRTIKQQGPENKSEARQVSRYSFVGGTGKGGNSAAQDHPGTNEGITGKPGDQGVPGGTPGSPNYSGSPGNGNGGINHTLTGRNIVAFPPRDADFKEGGRVVVRVTVNRAGVITDKRIVSASNSALRELALHKVDKIKFSKSDTAPEEQFGNITFVFKTRS